MSSGMLWQHSRPVRSPFVLRSAQAYDDHAHRKVLVVFMSLLLSFLARRKAFRWSPALDLSDRAVYSALIPGTQY